MSFQQFCNKISRTSDAEWATLIAGYRSRTRQWVQAHGEVSAFLGFLAGMVIVLFMRFFAWLFFIVAVIAAIIWLRAPESGRSNSGCCRRDPE